MVSYCRIRLLWSGVGGQLLSHQIAVVKSWWPAIVTSNCCGQGLVVSYCHIMLLWSGVGGQLSSHHVAVVRGWWSAIVTSCCCGQGLVVSYCHIMLLWSGVGGQLLTRSLEGPFRKAFRKNQKTIPLAIQCSYALRIGTVDREEKLMKKCKFLPFSFVGGLTNRELHAKKTQVLMFGRTWFLNLRWRKSWPRPCNQEAQEVCH